MRTYTRADLAAALSRVGLVSDDLLLVHSNLFSLGRMEGVNRADEFYAEVLGAFRDVIGTGGSIVSPVHTPQCPRYGVPFVLEETKSVSGSFGEWLRQQPETRRSLHPLNSYVVAGPHADALCDRPASNGWGEDSLPGRMVDLGAKGVIVGGEMIDHERIFSLTWHHWMECVAGAPYLYNKLLQVEVHAGGRRVGTVFSSSVRWLHLEVEHDLQPLHRRLLADGRLRSTELGSSKVHAVSAADYCNEGFALLAEDIHGFLAHPPDYVLGEPPADGPTAGRAGDVARAGLNE